ncbi:MAG: YdcF family protein [Acetobacteraceae bacterium]|nr:YdcF family protein [Acetobacteraceae bacterium]
MSEPVLLARRMRPARRIRRTVLAMAAALALTWSGGFAWFVHRASVARETPATADGIVALTGGSGRIETALQLLAERRARLALLSGIGSGVELGELARRAGVDVAPLAGRVTLGRQATSTRGNAAETVAWARENAIRSLIVVTASYHMPRALLEMTRAMPGIVLYPVTVAPAGMNGPGGIRDAGMLRLMAEEYTKWLAASLGLSAYEPLHAMPGRTVHASIPG